MSLMIKGEDRFSTIESKHKDLVALVHHDHANGPACTTTSIAPPCIGFCPTKQRAMHRTNVIGDGLVREAKTLPELHPE